MSSTYKKKSLKLTNMFICIQNLKKKCFYFWPKIGAESSRKKSDGIMRKPIITEHEGQRTIKSIY